MKETSWSMDFLSVTTSIVQIMPLLYAGEPIFHMKVFILFPYDCGAISYSYSARKLKFEKPRLAKSAKYIS